MLLILLHQTGLGSVGGGFVLDIRRVFILFATYYYYLSKETGVSDRWDECYLKRVVAAGCVKVLCDPASVTSVGWRRQAAAAACNRFLVSPPSSFLLRPSPSPRPLRDIILRHARSCEDNYIDSANDPPHSTFTLILSAGTPRGRRW